MRTFETTRKIVTTYVVLPGSGINPMRRVIFVALRLTPVAFAAAQAPPPTPALDAADLDAYARQVLADWHAPGVALAVVKDDKVVLVRGYGVRDVGKPDPVDEHTVF